jgi:hypothetical protein
MLCIDGAVVKKPITIEPGDFLLFLQPNSDDLDSYKIIFQDGRPILLR